MKRNSGYLFFLFGTCSLFLPTNVIAQKTVIRGFADASILYAEDKVSFGIGEQDLFITSELSDRISFLGETVFKYDHASETQFSVSIERIVIKYNYSGNHNILLGKHHTPLNYWNDTYHHGRLFFPTIERPLIFSHHIIPLHTTGIGFRGQDLGGLKLGYDVLIGNGLGSEEIADNDQHKSWTLGLNAKPIDKWRFGVSYYNDVISEGADLHGDINHFQTNQQLYTGSVSYFGKKFELLTEGTLGSNKTDSTGVKQTQAVYLYGGYKWDEKLTFYLRLDRIHYEEGELYYTGNNASAFLVGTRYQFNYLAVIKLEYQYKDDDVTGISNVVSTQVAIGF